MSLMDFVMGAFVTGDYVMGDFVMGDFDPVPDLRYSYSLDDHVGVPKKTYQNYRFE